jgi:hypothetical protein
MNTIQTFEEAAEKLGIDPKALPEVSALPEKHQKAIIAHYKLVIIAQAINDGWEPDWSNDDQWKYYPWFYVDASADKPSGSGLSYHDYDSVRSRTDVGSRLCFDSREAARYAGEKFKELYEDYFLIN